MAFTGASDGPVHSREASEDTANHVMRRPPWTPAEIEAAYLALLSPPQQLQCFVLARSTRRG
jgi:hypothetical protein